MEKDKNKHYSKQPYLKQYNNLNKYIPFNNNPKDKYS